MSKRILSLILVLTMVMSFSLVGCGEKKEQENAEAETTETTDETQDEAVAELTKVGMVTDSGTIDDKSFNQGTWEGILKYEQEKGTIETKYLQPGGEKQADYVNTITDLVDNGYNIIVTPGFKFETAINEAADKFKDTSFILIDGMPKLPDSQDFVKHDNVVSVFFNEHEAGFLAGVAAAMSTKTGKLGFIGGMDIPPVQKFGWGFKAGVEYAKANYGATAEVADYIYQGTFNDTAAGQQLANGMYDKGIDIIFHAAGGVGVGVITAAKERATKGEEVFVVGVDVDQYADGIYDEANKKSVILTSAMKRIDVAAYNYIDSKINSSFPGGEIITLTLADDGVGLPEENPNLSDDAKAKADEVKQLVIDGKVKVPSTQEELDKFIAGDYTLSK